MNQKRLSRNDLPVPAVTLLIDWEEFSARFASELKRLGVSDRDARFLGFDAPDARIFELLALLPDNVGVEAFYRHLGADFNELVRRETDSPFTDA